MSPIWSHYAKITAGRQNEHVVSRVGSAEGRLSHRTPFSGVVPRGVWGQINGVDDGIKRRLPGQAVRIMPQPRNGRDDGHDQKHPPSNAALSPRRSTKLSAVFSPCSGESAIAYKFQRALFTTRDCRRSRYAKRACHSLHNQRPLREPGHFQCPLGQFQPIPTITVDRQEEASGLFPARISLRLVFRCAQASKATDHTFLLWDENATLIFCNTGGCSMRSFPDPANSG
jgi:hypothetical protein